MLRITFDTSSQPTTLILEGKLVGPRVDELEQSWDRFTGRVPRAPIIVDPSKVTFVDSEGRQLLGTMFHEGADLRSAHLMTKYIVDQLTGRREG